MPRQKIERGQQLLGSSLSQCVDVQYLSWVPGGSDRARCTEGYTVLACPPGFPPEGPMGPGLSEEGPMPWLWFMDRAASLTARPARTRTAVTTPLIMASQ